MTLGHAKGLEEGHTQGRVAALLDLCAAKFGDLAESQRIRIQSCDELTVRRALKKILAAGSFEDLFD